MKKLVGLLLCSAFLAGCGDDQKYAECSDAQKSGPLNGSWLVPDDGINQGACMNLNTASEEELDAHEMTAVGDKKLCQWSAHKNTNWLCVYAPISQRRTGQGPGYRYPSPY